MVSEKFQIYSVKVTANLWVNKLDLSIFSHVPKQNFPPCFYQYCSGRRKFPIAPKECFLKMFFPEEKVVEKIRELKKLPKSTKASVTSFDKFHHLCNLNIFGLCFAVQ